jgi:hypothetical protein
MWHHRSLAWVLCAALLASPIACSFSHSSKSSSDSSTSPSKSSRSSSGDDTTEFHHDVEQYTAAYVQGGGTSQSSFFSGLSQLARKRGVSDWEAEDATWESIGRGLGRAEVGDAERTAYVQAWAGDDDAHASAIERGYEASH